MNLQKSIPKFNFIFLMLILPARFCAGSHVSAKRLDKPMKGVEAPASKTKTTTETSHPALNASLEGVTPQPLQAANPYNRHSCEGNTNNSDGSSTRVVTSPSTTPVNSATTQTHLNGSYKESTKDSNGDQRPKLKAAHPENEIIDSHSTQEVDKGVKTSSSHRTAASSFKQQHTHSQQSRSESVPDIRTGMAAQTHNNQRASSEPRLTPNHSNEAEKENKENKVYNKDEAGPIEKWQHCVEKKGFLGALTDNKLTKSFRSKKNNKSHKTDSEQQPLPPTYVEPNNENPSTEPYKERLV